VHSSVVAVLSVLVSAVTMLHAALELRKVFHSTFQNWWNRHFC